MDLVDQTQETLLSKLLSLQPPEQLENEESEQSEDLELTFN
jgi:hypothetical protein